MDFLNVSFLLAQTHERRFGAERRFGNPGDEGQGERVVGDLMMGLLSYFRPEIDIKIRIRWHNEVITDPD